MPEASRSAVRRFLPLLWISIAAFAAWVVFQRIEEIDFEDVAQHLSSVPLPTIITALLCAAGVQVLLCDSQLDLLSGWPPAAPCAGRHFARR